MDNDYSLKMSAEGWMMYGITIMMIILINWVVFEPLFTKDKTYFTEDVVNE